MEALAALAIILANVGSTALRGLVISHLWGWFVVSQFPGAPRLGVVAAIGLAFTVTTLIGTDSILRRLPEPATKESKNVQAAQQVLTAILTSLAVWGFGWVLAQML